MDRAERIGLGVAVFAHIALFALLSTVWLSRPEPPLKLNQPMEVVLTDEVGRISAAPSKTEPAPTQAREQAKPQDAAPPPAPASKPEPAPAKPAPPPPEPKRAPEPKPIAKPAPEPKPVTKPVPEPKPAPKPKTEPTPKPEAARAKPSPATSTSKPTSAKLPPTHDRLSPDFLKDLSTSGEGAITGAKMTRPTGARLGKDFLKGLSDKDSPSKSSTPKASAVSAAAMNGLGAAIQRQVHPCYDIGSLAGTPAMSIRITLRLRFNPDGSVAGTEVIDQTGVTTDNRSYAQQIADVAKRAVLRCAPVHLPADLYQGGWDDINLRFNPSQM